MPQPFAMPSVCGSEIGRSVSRVEAAANTSSDFSRQESPIVGRSSRGLNDVLTSDMPEMVSTTRGTNVPMTDPNSQYSRTGELNQALGHTFRAFDGAGAGPWEKPSTSPSPANEYSRRKDVNGESCDVAAIIDAMLAALKEWSKEHEAIMIKALDEIGSAVSGPSVFRRGTQKRRTGALPTVMKLRSIVETGAHQNGATEVITDENGIGRTVAKSWTHQNGATEVITDEDGIVRTVATEGATECGNRRPDVERSNSKEDIIQHTISKNSSVSLPRPTSPYGSKPHPTVFTFAGTMAKSGSALFSADNSGTESLCNTKSSLPKGLGPEISPSGMLRQVSPGHTHEYHLRGKSAEYIFNFMEDSDTSRAAQVYAKLYPTFIFFTMFIGLLQVIEDPPLEGNGAFYIELLFDSILAFEVLLRFAVCPNQRTFFFGAYNIIDCLTLPVLVIRVAAREHLPVISMNDNTPSLQWVGFCFVPVIRLLRLLRRFQEFHLLLEAFAMAFEALPVLIFLYFVQMLFFAGLIFAVEPVDNVESLTHAMWLTIVTMTTVGYGDVSPVSTGGRITIGALALSSALYMAVPLGIIGSCFSEVWTNREKILLLQKLRSNLLQHGYGAQDLPNLFHHFDADSDGNLDYSEFKALVQGLRLGMAEDKLVRVYNNFDVDGNGSVDDRDLVQALFPVAYHRMYDKDGELKIEEAHGFRMSMTAGLFGGE